MFSRLLSVDPSLTCSGWALFEVAQSELLAVGKIRTLPPREALARRLQLLQDRVQALYEKLAIGEDDVVVVEAATTMRDPSAALKVEQVRGIFEVLARGRNVCVPGRINPRSVHFEVMGLRGVQCSRRRVKDSAIQVVQSVYREALTKLGFCVDADTLRRHQDIVDAILLGNLGLLRVQNASAAGIPLEVLFGMERMKRPPVMM